jgi:hypothetical protein
VLSLYVRDKVADHAPPKSLPRERWLTREEGARFVIKAWRYREKQNYRATDRRTRKHIAKFALVALYTFRLPTTSSSPGNGTFNTN